MYGTYLLTTHLKLSVNLAQGVFGVGVVIPPDLAEGASGKMRPLCDCDYCLLIIILVCYDAIVCSVTIVKTSYDWSPKPYLDWFLGPESSNIEHLDLLGC